MSLPACSRRLEPAFLEGEPSGEPNPHPTSQPTRRDLRLGRSFTSHRRLEDLSVVLRARCDSSGKTI